MEGIDRQRWRGTGSRRSRRRPHRLSRRRIIGATATTIPEGTTKDEVFAFQSPLLPPDDGDQPQDVHKTVTGCRLMPGFSPFALHGLENPNRCEWSASGATSGTSPEEKRRGHLRNISENQQDPETTLTTCCTDSTGVGLAFGSRGDGVNIRSESPTVGANMLWQVETFHLGGGNGSSSFDGHPLDARSSVAVNRPSLRKLRNPRVRSSKPSPWGRGSGTSCGQFSGVTSSFVPEMSVETADSANQANQLLSAVDACGREVIRRSFQGNESHRTRTSEVLVVSRNYLLHPSGCLCFQTIASRNAERENSSLSHRHPCCAPNP